MLFWLLERGLDYQGLRAEFPALVQVHFSSQRKRMTSVVEVQGRRLALVKGAPEWLLERSGHFLNAGGREQAMTPTFRAQILAGLRKATTQAMRTLGFAMPRSQLKSRPRNWPPSEIRWTRSWFSSVMSRSMTLYARRFPRPWHDAGMPALA